MTVSIRAAVVRLVALSLLVSAFPSSVVPAYEAPHSHGPVFPTGSELAAMRPLEMGPLVSKRGAAGGPGTAHRAGGRQIPPARGDRVPRARVFYTDTLAAEPTLGVDRKGRVFFVTLDTSSGVPVWPVLRSANGGRDWVDVSPRLGDSHAHPTGQDPMLYLDKDTDRIFTADFNLPCTPVSFTDDGGSAWVTGSACGLGDHQNLFTGPPAISPTVGYPNVVYYCAVDAGLFQEASNATGCLKSLDGGITFARTGAPSYVNGINPDPGNFGIPGHCSGVTGHGFVDRKGTVYIPRGWCGQPWLAISHDEGATWTRVQVADNGMPSQAGGPQDYDPMGAPGFQEHEAGVAVDKRGNIFFVWTGQDRLPYLTVSRDGGQTWDKPMMVGPPGLKEASLPAIDIGSDGKIAIAYIGSKDAPGGDAPDGEGPEYAAVTWHGFVTTSKTALGRDPLFYTSAVNPPRDPLVIGSCGILRCQQVYDFIDVVVDRRGNVWTSMVDACLRTSCDSVGSGILGRITGGPR